MKFPEEGQEVLGKCLFTNSYEDPYERWLVVYYQGKKWRDTIEGEEQDVVFWVELPMKDEKKSMPASGKSIGSFDSLNPLPKKKQKNWDEDSLKQLQSLINEKKTLKEICDIMQVSFHSVKSAKDRYKIRRQHVESVQT